MIDRRTLVTAALAAIAAPASTRSVLAQADVKLGVADDLKVTPGALYHDRPIGLSLNGGASIGSGHG